MEFDIYKATKPNRIDGPKLAPPANGQRIPWLEEEKKSKKNT